MTEHMSINRLVSQCVGKSLDIDWATNLTLTIKLLEGHVNWSLRRTPGGYSIQIPGRYGELLNSVPAETPELAITAWFLAEHGIVQYNL